MHTNARKSRTSVRVLKKQDNTENALDLKRQGATIRQIAKALGVGVGTAHKLVDEGIKAIPTATREALIAEIHDRQMGIVAAHWQNRSSPDSAKVIQASDALLVNVFGLAAPSKTVTTTVDVTQSTPAQARKIMAELFGSVGPAGVLPEQVEITVLPEGPPAPTPAAAELGPAKLPETD